MRRFIITGIPIFLIWLAFAPQVSAGVIYVNDDAPGPVHNGNSWNEAFTSLQDALDAAQTYDTIWVAKGTYKPEKLFDPNEPRSASFSLINHVGVFGGFAGTEDPAGFDLDDRDFELNETILTGDLNGNGRDPNDSYHVFYHPQGTNLDPNAVLDGFTITGGNADAPDPSYDSFHNDGAGIYNYQSSPRISNCKFTDNYARSSTTGQGGGGIYSYESDTIITNCTFIRNTSISGGGIHNEYGQPIIDNCCFYDNYSGAGGGIHTVLGSPIITNCTFFENGATGGGAVAASSGTSYIANCRFENNRAYGGQSVVIDAGPAPGGGGIRMWGSDCTVEDCEFINNSVEYGDRFFGGGICILYGGSPTIINCLFAGNKARGDYNSRGGGMFISGGINSTLINCIFTGNSAILSDYINDEYYEEGRGGGIYNHSGDMTLINCTLTGNWVGYMGQGGAIYNRDNLSVTNSIIWWNFVHDYYDYEAYIPKPWNSFINEDTTPDISNSNIFACGGSDYWNSGFGNDLGGNIDEVPNFIDADGSDNIFGTEDDNVSLLPDSVCIDAGDNSALPADILTDILGNNRFFDDPNTSDTGSGTGAIVDMGACEYDGSWQQPQGTIIYVNDDVEDANDGSSWENAYNNLQDALDAAAYGDNIWIAKGTYIPTERIVFYDGYSAVFRLSNGVKLLGGFAGTENPDTFDIDERDFAENETILSGEGYIFNILYNDVSLALNRMAELDGFTISGSRIAIYNEVSSPTIRNCTFRGSGEWSGPAVHNYYSASRITKCQFVDNMVMGVSGFPDADFGGTIYNRYSRALIEESTFIGNIHDGLGSAIFIDHWDGGILGYRLPEREPTIASCIFIDNTSEFTGAAIESHGCNIDIINCCFRNNSANFGGALYNATSTIDITNCTFEGNRTDTKGGGIYLCQTTCQLSNSIFWDNIASEDFGPQIAIQGENNVSIDYCDIQGGHDEISVDETSLLNWGTGNIDLNPLFADDDNLRLLLGSPCIDAGDNSAVPVDTTTDIQGWSRFLDDPHAADTGAGSAPIVDMGAYERDHRDINSDGRFNLEDLAALSANWLLADCGPCDGANLNTDTEANIADLFILTETYLR